MLVCSSPQLIAAYHVLHRLLEPRHPPYALNCFKKYQIFKCLTTYYCYSVLQLFITQYVKELTVKIHSCPFEHAVSHYRRWLDYESTGPKPHLKSSISLKELACLFNNPTSPSLLLSSVEDIGVEPMTLCVQGRCSSQLS